MTLFSMVLVLTPVLSHSAFHQSFFLWGKILGTHTTTFTHVVLFIDSHQSDLEKKIIHNLTNEWEVEKKWAREENIGPLF